MKCKRGHELQVMKSNMGYYIGTESSEDGSPYCRLSQEYFLSAKEAEDALKGCEFTMRNHSMEVVFCNGGKGCFARN